MSRSFGLNIIALLALIGLALNAGPAAAAPKPPLLVFEKNQVLFENVREGEKLKAEFPFTNQGGMNLIIDKVSPSCGCTVAEFQRVTEPGQKGKIVLTLDTSGIHGHFRKTATVASNDNSQPFHTLIMIGETKSLIEVEGGRRIQLRGCLGEDVVTKVKLKSTSDKPVFIAGVDNPMKDYVDATVAPLPGGKEFELTLRSKVTEAMQFAGPIFFKVPGASRVSVFVVVNVMGPFEVRPHEVYWGGLGKGVKATPRNVMIRKACAPELKVDRVEVDRNMFDVSEHWQKEDTELILTVTPKPEAMPKGPFSQKLTIVTGEKGFSVDLKGVIR